MEQLAPGAMIGGRFEIETPLGKGGLGDLYRAIDRKSDKPVAIRILASDVARSEVVLDRLRAQVKLASALSHKNIVRVFGMGKEGGLRYLAMEYVEGQSLRVLIERKHAAGRTFSLKGAYNVLAHVCNALHHAHETMIHGLPGPGSVLINRAGRVKVSEFGATRALEPGSSAVNRLGDVYCLAPEMHSNPATAGRAADIYAMGVLLHELLTGQPPTHPPRPMTELIAGIPSAVEDVVWRCLQPEPSSRFADAQQLKAAFYSSFEGYERSNESGLINIAGGAMVSAQPPAQEPSARPQQAAVRQPAVTNAASQVDLPTAGPQPAIAAPTAQADGGAQPQAQRYASADEMIAAVDGDAFERWLVQKNRFDYGPYTTGNLLRALKSGEFTPDDLLVDQDSGWRGTARQNTELRDFVPLLDRHLAVHHARKAEDQRRVQDSKRRTVMMVLLVVGILVLAGGGVTAAYLLTREPEVREKIVYRQQTLPSLKGIDVQWNAEPAEQAKKRRRLARKRPRRKKTGRGQDDNVTRLGDATEEGGDALLSQKVVQNVMRSNFGKLTRCVQQEWRRNRALRTVTIDFGIQGSGRVSSIKVNGQASGPFHSCVSNRMRNITFPPFDGTITRASFSMSLKI